MNTKAKISAHVVLGLDKDGKPRAALIHPADLQAATKAAMSLGFKIGRADTPHALQMAKRLPDAKIFATGHGLVPLVRKDIYEWLSKGLTLLEPKAEAPAEAAKAGIAANDTAAGPKNDNGGNGGHTSVPLKPDPRLWDQLTVGSIVVAPEGSTKDDGFWPAVVTAVSKDGAKLTIRWRDFPQQPPLIVKRRSVALLLDHR